MTGDDLTLSGELHSLASGFKTCDLMDEYERYLGLAERAEQLEQRIEAMQNGSRPPGLMVDAFLDSAPAEVREYVERLRDSSRTHYRERMRLAAQLTERATEIVTLRQLVDTQRARIQGLSMLNSNR